MANSLTNLSVTMIEDEVLPALKLGLSPLNAMSFQTTSTPSAVGDIVRVPIVAARTAGTYSTTFAVDTGNTLTSAAVTMAAPTFAAWYVNPQTEAFPTAARFLASGRECAYAVAKSVVQGVLKNFVLANIGNTSADKLTVTAANYDTTDQAGAWGLLKTKGVSGEVSAIHSIDYAANLLKDNALRDRSASGSNIIQTGEFPPIVGMRQFYTDAFPTELTNENTGVLFTGKNTAAVAMTVPAAVEAGLEGAAGVRIEQITDPGSGLSMVWRTWMNADTGVYWGAVYVMYGTAFVQDAAIRIVSA